MLFRSCLPFLSVILALSACLAPVTADASISGGDDFNDNIRDQAKWGASDLSEGGGTLTEISQRLEYTTSSPTAVQNSYRPWVLNKATYDTNWEIILDVTNAAAPSSEDAYASMGFEIFPPNTRSRSLYTELIAYTNDGVNVRRAFDSDLLEGSNSLGYRSESITGATGSLRVTFDAAAKVLAFYKDVNGGGDGYQWVRQSSYGIAGSGGTTANTSWAMSGADLFQVNIYGYSQIMSIGAGKIHADNFSASSGTSTTMTSVVVQPDGSVLLTGSVYPNGLETSVVFELAANSQFLEPRTSAPEIIPATASNRQTTATMGNLVPGAAYWVRTRATNSGGSITGNVLTFATPPYTLSVNQTTGSVTSSSPQASHPLGATVTLTATPPVGAAFINWSGSVNSTQNPLTVVMDGNKTITANFTVSIAEAADSPGLTFTTGGTKGWFGQSTTTHDGIDSIQSGDVGNSQQSWFQTTVTGPGTLSYWTRVSSESGDALEIRIDNLPIRDRIGGLANWQKKTYEIESGSHTIRWSYIKDFIDDGGADTAWVDEISWVPATTDFATWRTTHFTSGELADASVSGPDADPDHDGVANLLEFALGGLPKNGGSRPAPVTSYETIGGERYLALAIAKPAGVGRFNYAIKVSPDLKNWSTGSPHTTVLTDDTTTLKVRDNTPAGSGATRFIRLEVTTTP
ncbi:hypothetical protein JIN84_10705 [Luteolibacter yonseiensis]|uniref:Bacterial repeat domain-containing protein n=1 Tax=Luteolibacter yonseiensis TaxID=1144680 RepID=A0A934V7F4_9BACT|nr:hypothetical protein [Luteolibacter yonseiensis]MBK1816082.1 hypothetical protein [Luteolibacter yonseiensis]